MENPKKQVNFFIIAFGIIFTTGLLIAIHLPEISAWRNSVSDRLLIKAEAAKSSDEKYGWLMQAHLFNQRDPATVAALANFYKDNGEVTKAIDIYTTGIAEPNYVYLGNLALQDQNYLLANKMFERAGKDKRSAESLSGAAVALLNLGKLSEGCQKADEAGRLNLGSDKAKSAITACEVLKESTGSDLSSEASLKDDDAAKRRAAYILLKAQVYKQAEAKLESLNEKLAQDYLELAKLAAGRGEMKPAVVQAEKAREADEVNFEVNNFLLRLYVIENNKEKIEFYKTRVEQIEKLRSIR